MNDRNAEIVRLWNANKSATFISMELNITRNTIIGVVTRLRPSGIITRPIVFEYSKRGRLGNIAKHGHKLRKPRDQKIKLPDHLLTDAPIMYQDENSSAANGLALIDLEHNQCRFPTSRFNDQHYFCGAVTRDSKTNYCSEHHGIVFVKKRKLTPAEIAEIKKCQSLKQWLAGAQR